MFRWKRVRLMPAMSTVWLLSLGRQKAEERDRWCRGHHCRKERCLTEEELVTVDRQRVGLGAINIRVE